MARLIHPADIEFFLALANTCSVSKTAHELGITPPAVSKRLSLMETRLGVPLFNRTTRSMGLTPEGEVYLEHARKILGNIGELEDQLLGSTVSPQGLLRVNATLGFGRSHIAPLISEFVKKYPKVDIQLQLSVNPPPSGDDAYDICFRFGSPPESRSIARWIGANRRLVVASPAYLKKHGEPKAPEDLAQHNCIGIRQGDDAYGLWRFTAAKGKGKNRIESMQSVRVRGNLTTNDGGIAVNWALDGHGILLRAGWDVQKYLQSGRLVQLLPHYNSPDADIYAVYAQRHRTSLRVKTFLDFVVAASQP
ncbi:LysR family transcriptional regulator [Rhodococcus sp. SRB_17]|uniref:LysR family transcriptional regulator n=1 Tax=Acidovorax sp. SRB_24 TaxID=1962700 RepID=UPI00145DAEA7|nr:LysR family transcriptional regulator [Acidovorax sp. SRB_24]NMM77182.1 LysR family transcriptional regulator [Acidovorax sp. SRB_24]NMM88866.1 LysR family transcriptional regulator [Rhodococcus sp. SRB_17]